MQKACLLVHLKHGAVGGEACLQAYGNAGGKLATKGGGAKEHDLGAALLHKIAEPVCVDVCIVAC